MSQKSAPFYAFTAKSDGLSRSLETEVDLLIPPNNKKEDSHKYKAIWDTGATSTVITPKVVKEMGLIPSGKSVVRGVTGSETCNTYLLNIALPNKVLIPGVRIVEVPQISGDSEILIGMDIISLGDFSITNTNGKTVFSFRVPSITEIDYVKESKTATTSNQKSNVKKVGRNEPCPCGSGKKYKLCHGKPGSR